MRMICQHYALYGILTAKREAVMNTVNFDWRLVAVLLVLFLMLFSRNPQTNIVVLAIGAGWAIQAGLAPWRGSRGVLGSSKVTYWRGQRIVTKQRSGGRGIGLSPVQIGVSLLYLTLGLGMVFAAIAIFVRLARFA